MFTVLKDIYGWILKLFAGAQQNLKARFEELDSCPQTPFGSIGGQLEMRKMVECYPEGLSNSGIHWYPKRLQAVTLYHLRREGRWLGNGNPHWLLLWEGEQRPSSVIRWNPLLLTRSTPPPHPQWWSYRSKGSKINKDHHRRHHGSSYPRTVWDETIRRLTHASKEPRSQEHTLHWWGLGRLEKTVLMWDDCERSTMGHPGRAHRHPLTEHVGGTNGSEWFFRVCWLWGNLV